MSDNSDDADFADKKRCFNVLIRVIRVNNYICIGSYERKYLRFFRENRAAFTL